MKKPFYFQMAVKGFEKKALADGTQVVRVKGLASTPQIDRYNDRIEPAAFADALKTYLTLGTLLRSHDQDRPAGKVDTASVTDAGLEIEADILDAQCQQEVMDGRLGAFSIGYRALESTLEHEDGTPFNAEVDSWWDPALIRVIKKVDLVEISLVTCPANPGALFTIAKSVKAFFDKQAAFVKKAVEVKGLTASADIALEFKSYGAEDIDFEGKQAIDEAAAKEDEKAVEKTEEQKAEEAKAAGAAPAAEGAQEAKAEGAEAEKPKPEAQKEPEKPAETAGADGGEGGEAKAKPTEEPKAEGAEGKKAEEAAPAPTAEAKAIVLTIKDLKPYEVLASILGKEAVKSILPEDMSLDAVRTVEVPEEIKAAMSGIIETMEKAVTAEIKRADDLQAIVDKMPTKRALAPFGPYAGADSEKSKSTDAKPKEVSEGFKSLFKNALSE